MKIILSQYPRITVILERGYTGSVEYSEEDHCLYGKVLGMSKHAITYEGQDVDDLKKDFEGAIDDFIASQTRKTILG